MEFSTIEITRNRIDCIEYHQMLHFLFGVAIVFSKYNNNCAYDTRKALIRKNMGNSHKHHTQYINHWLISYFKD